MRHNNKPTWSRRRPLKNVLGKLGIGLSVVMLASGIVTSSAAVADDPAFITGGIGYYDINRQTDDSAEFRLEYRSDKKIWEVKPFAALAATSNGSIFVGAGVLMDVYFGNRFVLTPSFAPHYYHEGSSSKKDLGHEIEFRSQLELAYRFDDRSRLGLSISHYSNASLSNKNPGSETLMLNYSVPTSSVSDWLE
jgi:lipid A 3-O-deacylase